MPPWLLLSPPTHERSRLLYSQRPKSEHVRFSVNAYLFGYKKRSVIYNAEIRTNLFGFQTLVCVRNPNEHMFERSDFGQLAKLGRFIYKDRHEKNICLYKTV